MDDLQYLTQLLQSTDTPDSAWVQSMAKEHPAFILPALLLLKRGGDQLNADLRRQLHEMVVLNCGDPTALVDYIDALGGGWATFYPHMQPHQSSTEETIDDFLHTFGTVSTPEEDAVLERLLFNPVPADYFAGTDEPYDPEDPLALPPELRRDDDAEEDTTVEVTSEAPETPPEASNGKNKAHGHSKGGKVGDESLLMESLAKIFIKQHRYERAFEIISKLSLNYPEKSVYFADQLRFLRKLIINQQHLEQQNQ